MLTVVCMLTVCTLVYVHACLCACVGGWVGGVCWSFLAASQQQLGIWHRFVAVSYM